MRVEQDGRRVAELQADEERKARHEAEAETRHEVESRHAMEKRVAVGLPRYCPPCQRIP